MKVGILFEGVGHPQEHPLIEMLPHDLKAHGKSLVAETAGDRDGGSSCQNHWNGMDIG